MDIYNSKGVKINLGQQNYLTEGGEGKLYADQDHVYKIYLDKSKIIPVPKLEELSELKRKNIIRPLGSIFDTRQNRIGFQMNRIKDPVPLARIFTTSYWNDNNVTPEKMAQLIKSMQETIQFIHKKGFLQIDGNEFNYITNTGLTQPYFIDVDSFQTPGYPGTAIMPSIRDYTQNEFNEGSDWFSFAVIAFQMLVGIHPFKGRHKDFKRGDFESRIKAGISVFNSEVSYPSSVRDFSLIPKNYRQWFEAVFEKGIRVDPPTGELMINGIDKPQVVMGSEIIHVKEWIKFTENIRHMGMINGQMITLLQNQVAVGKTTYDLPDKIKGLIIDDSGIPVFLGVKNQQLVAFDGDSGGLIKSGIRADKVMVANNDLYAIEGGNLVEVDVFNVSGKLMMAPLSTRKIMTHSSIVLKNMIYENIMGQAYLNIFVDSGNIPSIKIAELNDYKIVDGRFEKGIAVLQVYSKGSEYEQVRIRFSENYQAYDINFIHDVDESLNFTVLDKGIVVYLSSDGSMELMPKQPFSDQSKIINDNKIKTFMKLVNNGDNVIFFNQNKVYKLKLSK